MPVELSELLNDERWVEVEVGSTVLNIAYRPGATSLHRQAAMQKMVRQLGAQEDTDETEQAEQMGAIFCEMVCAWDLTDQGKPLAITPEIVTKRLPGAIFNAIMQAIGEDGQAQQEEKKALLTTSATGSSARGRRANAQSGTRTSAPPGSWA